jgi:hypothetical protein
LSRPFFRIFYTGDDSLVARKIHFLVGRIGSEQRPVGASERCLSLAADAVFLARASMA